MDNFIALWEVLDLLGGISRQLTILLAIRVITLKTEVSTRHKRHILVYLPVETYVKTVVEVMSL